ncbi:MAG: NADH-quinone oxidoreductase subunit M [Planctomycetota bacterium]|nr:NADH-quinone oxidoreductase subunit M [Planctomycetota bacterium]
MLDPLVLLSLIVFLPVLGAVVLAFVPSGKDELARYITLGVTLAVLALCVIGFFGNGETEFDAAEASMQSVFNLPWIPSFNIEYYMGLDGISFPLVMLTALVCVLAMGASWSITKHVKGYCILFLLLETGMLGVFVSLDFFLFYVFWEVMLLPMYFLIGVWGGERREYAAIKFFLYTLVGSVLMLIAILMLYFNSDLREVAKISTLVQDEAPVVWEDLHVSPDVEARIGRVITAEDSTRPGAVLALMRTGDSNDHALTVRFQVAASGQPTASLDGHVVTVNLSADHATAADVVKAINGTEGVSSLVHATALAGGQGLIVPADEVELPATDKPVHTFNLLALAKIGQHTECFNDSLLFGWSLQRWAFILLFIGFAIKVPSVPLHTWLPDAHVQAPTPISMILAGVLLKMGGYGIIRICYPICPAGGYELAYLVCLIGVVSMVYGAFAALAQTDFKRLVAYSSVSHMGYVVLGLGVWSARGGNLYNADYWNMGMQGAMFQMIAHGISSTGMFFMVGVIYDRVHHRDLNKFGGLFSKMPVYTSLAIIIFFAGMGLPGLCGFPGEVIVVFSSFAFSPLLAIISASVVILTAGYILWAVQRVYLGAEYNGPHEEALVPSTLRENTIAGVLCVLAVVFGVWPYQTLFRYMDKTVEAQAQDLTDWTIDHEATAAATASGASVTRLEALEENGHLSPAARQFIYDGASNTELANVTIQESPPVLEQQQP